MKNTEKDQIISCLCDLRDLCGNSVTLELPQLAGRTDADKIEILWRNIELLGCRAMASDMT